MSLTILPNELLVIIGKYVLLQEDLNSLARTSTRMYSIFDPILYHREVHKFKSHALNYAVGLGRKSILLKLISHGAVIEPYGVHKIDESDPDEDVLLIGWYEAPLTCYAAYRGRVDIMEILLDNGASPNCMDEKGRTPLARALYWGPIEVVTKDSFGQYITGKGDASLSKDISNFGLAASSGLEIVSEEFSTLGLITN